MNLLARFFPAQRPRMRVPATICSWCGEVLRWVKVESEAAAPLLSHGICDECAKQFTMVVK